MKFTAPIGTVEERATGKIWPGRWIDATGYLTNYSLGYHTGADLNLNFPHFDMDAHSKVYTIGDGKVTYAKLFSTKYWGKIIVIDHGIVDGKPLFSRYGHVENIDVSVDESVSAGQIIGTVGNGEGLFPYHLHFDVSTTDKLLDQAWHWPGSNLAEVQKNYVNPKEWLQIHVSKGKVNKDKKIGQIYYVIATIGLRVRQDHSTAALQVGILDFGSKISIEDADTVDQDSYTWGRISGGMYNGDWVAMGKVDQSEIFLSRNPPGT